MRVLLRRIILFLIILIFLSFNKKVWAITCCSTAVNCSSYQDEEVICTNGTFRTECCPNSQDARQGPWCTLNGPFGGYTHDCSGVLEPTSTPTPFPTPTATPTAILIPTPTRVPTSTSTSTPTPTRVLTTPTPTRILTITPPTITPTSTPTVSLSCAINVPPDPASVPQGGSVSLLAAVSYSGARSLSYGWTASCGNVAGTITNAVYQASGVVVGDYCEVELQVAENGGLLTDKCEKWISITGAGQGMISGYVLTDGGAICQRDASSDSGIEEKNVLLRGITSPGSTITDSNGYFSFVKPVGSIYELVYTIGSEEQPIQACIGNGGTFPKRVGNYLVYDLAVVSSGLVEKNFYISPGAVTDNPAWIQTRGGDVHANSSIQLNIPSGSYFADSENSLITSFTDAYFDFLGGRPEHDTRGVRGNHWYVTYSSTIAKMQSGNKFFNFFSLKYPPEATISGNVLNLASFTANDGKIAIIGNGDISNSDDISLSSEVDLPSNSSNIIYVNDNLNINRRIRASGNSIMIFVIKGNLVIDSALTELDGVFFVDGIINTRGATAAIQALNINGMLFSSGDGRMFGVSRDLGTGSPAEIIIYQPKYLINEKLLQFFGKKDYVWQEVPG